MQLFPGFEGDNDSLDIRTPRWLGNASGNSDDDDDLFGTDLDSLASPQSPVAGPLGINASWARYVYGDLDDLHDPDYTDEDDDDGDVDDEDADDVVEDDEDDDNDADEDGTDNFDEDAAQDDVDDLDAHDIEIALIPTYAEDDDEDDEDDEDYEDEEEEVDAEDDENDEVDDDDLSIDGSLPVNDQDRRENPELHSLERLHPAVVSALSRRSRASPPPDVQVVRRRLGLEDSLDAFDPDENDVDVYRFTTPSFTSARALADTHFADLQALQG
ncbi:hypothetical protein HK405_012544 [Cladochytrium tenue]|nr:hypothetical protein HK405_012544 [Cladochytrium tenue]